MQRPTGCVLCPCDLFFRGSHFCNHRKCFVVCARECACVKKTRYYYRKEGCVNSKTPSLTHGHFNTNIKQNRTTLSGICMIKRLCKLSFNMSHPNKTKVKHPLIKLLMRNSQKVKMYRGSWTLNVSWGKKNSLNTRNATLEVEITINTEEIQT